MKKKILLVDDEDNLRMLYSWRLTEYGYHVTLADSGHMAIEILTQKRGAFDVVITDRDMPGMFGEEVVKFVKLHYPNIKIIFMSSDFSPTSYSDGKAAGADLVIEKSPGVMDKVRKFLEEMK